MAAPRAFCWEVVKFDAGAAEVLADDEGDCAGAAELLADDEDDCAGEAPVVLPLLLLVLLLKLAVPAQPATPSASTAATATMRLSLFLRFICWTRFRLNLREDDFIAMTSARSRRSLMVASATPARKCPQPRGYAADPLLTPAGRPDAGRERISASVFRASPSQGVRPEVFADGRAQHSRGGHSAVRGLPFWRCSAPGQGSRVGRLLQRRRLGLGRRVEAFASKALGPLIAGRDPGLDIRDGETARTGLDSRDTGGRNAARTLTSRTGAVALEDGPRAST